MLLVDLVECLQWEIKAVSNPRPPWVTGSTTVSKFVFEPVGLVRNGFYFSQAHRLFNLLFAERDHLRFFFFDDRNLGKKVSVSILKLHLSSG